MNAQTPAPNPASSAVSIHLHGLDKGGATLSIYNQLGCEVLRQDLAKGTHALTIDLPESRFVNGEYYVRLVSTKETVFKSLIINKQQTSLL